MITINSEQWIKTVQDSNEHTNHDHFYPVIETHYIDEDKGL